MVNGHRFRQCAPTCDAAKELLKKLTASPPQRASGETLEARRQQATANSEASVATVLERYLESTRLHCRPRTIRTTEAAVRRLDAVIGQVPAADLSRTEIDRYAAHRLALGVGPHTPNRELACLRAVLVQARDDELIDRVPKVRMLRTVQELPCVFSNAEIKTLTSRSGSFGIVFSIAAGAGLRAAEMTWLTGSDVDVEAGTLDLIAELDKANSTEVGE